MGHWNFSRTYYYHGVDGFTTQDTAVAFRYICNDDELNARVQTWIANNNQATYREPGMAFNMCRNWLSGLDWQKWSCWTADRKRNIQVDWGEIAHCILSKKEMFSE